jgi:hypothetical protein
VPWQSGHYYLFSKLFIRAVVPPESGVFALYDCHEQVFICEADDLRKTLLRLHADMLRFGFNRPAGFTFELSPSEFRRKRLKQLLTEHEIIFSAQPSNIVLYG